MEQGSAALPGYLYKRGEVYWARISANGHEHRGSLRTGNRSEAQKRLKVWAAKIIDAEYFGINRMTWQAAVVRYTTEVMPNQVKPGTQKRYRTSLKMLNPHLRGKHIDQIDRATLLNVIEKRRAEGASNATINRDMTAASQVLRLCVQWEAATKNVARELDRDLVSRERRDPITLPADDDIQAVLAECPGNFAPMVRFALLSGCRQEEIGSLTWRQVDLENAQLVLTRTKTGRARAVPLSPDAVALLKGLKVKKAPVFWHDDGERYANIASRFRLFVARAAENAETEFHPFRFHDLRHLFAVRYLKQAKGSIYDLQKILGHASIKTTEIYLAFLTPEEAGKVR